LERQCSAPFSSLTSTSRAQTVNSNICIEWERNLPGLLAFLN
jgi:hypothetical protein